MCIRDRQGAAGEEYIIASESVALDVLGFERVRDVEPGEGIVITDAGQLFSQQCAPKAEHATCIFEYVSVSYTHLDVYKIQPLHCS